MTRKHFQMIADVVAASEVTANLTTTQLEDIAFEFGRKLMQTNERFDAKRFFVACGVDAVIATEMSSQLWDGAVSYTPSVPAA
jgi:hypothetical protein